MRFKDGKTDITIVVWDFGGQIVRSGDDREANCLTRLLAPSVCNGFLMCTLFQQRGLPLPSPPVTVDVIHMIRMIRATGVPRNAQRVAAPARHLHGGVFHPKTAKP